MAGRQGATAPSVQRSTSRSTATATATGAPGPEAAAVAQAVGEGDDELGEVFEGEPRHETSGIGREPDLERGHRVGHGGVVACAEEVGGRGRAGRHRQGGVAGDDGPLVVGVATEQRVAEGGGGQAGVAPIATGREVVVDGGRGDAGGRRHVPHAGERTDDLLEARRREPLDGPVEDRGATGPPRWRRTGVRAGHRETLADAGRLR